MLRVIARLNMGGPAHQAALLSGRRLDPDRFETLLVHGRLAAGEDSMAGVAEREGARMRYLPTLVQPVNPANDLRALAALQRIVRKFRPHIVHTHTAKAGFVGRQAALLAGSRRPILVHTYHGHVLEGYFGRFRSGIYRRLERRLARPTDRLVAVSEATADDLARLDVVSRDRIQVIPLGLDLSRYLEPRPEDASLRGQLGLTDADVLAAFVGRVVPIKRLDVLIEALAQARQAGAPVSVAVVGGGVMVPEIERLAAGAGVAGAVHFLGYRSDLDRVFAAADIAVLSSDNEGTPVSLIEGGAAGLPAVATNVGGVAEVVVPETGVLVPPRDPVALGAALARLAGDVALRRRLGAAARERVISLYAVERLLADISSLYEALLAARSVAL